MSTNALPVVFECPESALDPLAWVSSNLERLDEQLLVAGAILLRGFSIDTIDTFTRTVMPLTGPSIEHPELLAGRKEVTIGVHTPTEYPADQQIAPHNEHSAALTFPGRLTFWCDVPALTGGETPLIDTRRVYARLDATIRERFDHLGWMLVRNYDDVPGRRWQTRFRTEQRDDVEAYCRDNGMSYEWKADGGLRTRQVRPASIVHPRTGERSWFNHVAFFHVSALPAPIQRGVRSAYAEADYPNHTCYGDGSPIDDATIAALQAAYRAETTAFAWRRGDVLVVDNILTAHARNAFTGPRRILLVISHPVTRTDIDHAR
jgi:alpha-ketoglutarate-dependent taurine dioxygenase